MKNLQRKYIYSFLALPFVAFGIYAATLPATDRSTFLSEFTHNTANLFRAKPEAGPEGISTSEGTQQESGSDASATGGRGGGGRRGGGGFDPVAFFESRDADGDGQLAGDEISDRMRENLEQTDANQDGAVTLEEFQESIQRRFAGRGPGGVGSPGQPGSGRSGFGGGPQEDRPERPQRPETE